MKPNGYITIFAVLNALVFLSFDDFAHAAQKKGGSADTHMSAKGQENTNSRWFADPDRGWVRSDERLESHPPPRKDTERDNKKHGKKIDERKVTNY
jgi:hypothetical protein